MTHRSFFFSGGVYVILTGSGRERFFNIAAQRRLTILEIRELDRDRACFWTTPEEFKKMKSAARKAGVRLSMKKKYGLPFFLYRNRKRRLLVLGVLSFFLILYTMSFFIWDISFEGNRMFTDEMLKHYMSTIPVACGMKKSDISCEALEEQIRTRFSEITWVSAQIKGTRLLIHIKENEAVLEPEEPDLSPCDLEAAKAGIITRCVVRSGFSQVKAGDEVKAGDLLVDGTIPIYDDSETLVDSHEVRAEGEIFARTVYEWRKRLPPTYTVNARTGRIRHGIFFKVFDRTFYFIMPKYGEESWEIVMEEWQARLFEDFYLPVYFGRISALEYIPYEKSYTEAMISAVKEKHVRIYMENLSEKGIQIVGNDGKIEKGESGWILKETITVIENIAKPVSIQEKHEENLTVNELN